VDATDRRASARIGPLTDQSSWLMPLGAAFPIVDLSRTGFAIATPFEFPQGSAHTFEFRLPGGARVPLVATPVYCAPQSGPGGTAAFKAGFAFAEMRPKDQLAVWVLLDAAKTRLTARTTRPRSPRHPRR
jgi:hypothetical protein